MMHSNILKVALLIFNDDSNNYEKVALLIFNDEIIMKSCTILMSCNYTFK